FQETVRGLGLVFVFASTCKQLKGGINMAKIVIAGSSDCPYYARVELLADYLAKNLPAFKLTKIVKTPEEWPDWSRQCCEERGWHQYKSPIVWRELVNQGGKGVLIGGANEFQEYAKAYYDFESDMTSPQQRAVANDNTRYKAKLDAETSALRAKSRPLRVTVTAACGDAAYHLLPLLADGSVFGCGTELAVTLYDRRGSDEMEGLAMEVTDLAQPLVRSIRCTRSLADALAGAELLVLLDELEPSQSAASGDSPANQGEARSHWLRRYASLYAEYAAAIQAAGCGGPAGIRILVSGRAPVNFGARVLLEWSAAGRARGGGPSAPHPDRVAATPRLMERWAKGAVAARLGQGRYEVNPACVGDLVIWGDPAGGHWPELDRANLGGEETGAVTGPDWYKRPLSEPLWDQEWVQTDLPRLLAKRQAESLWPTDGKAAGHFAASLARATADTLRDWWLGQAAGGGVTSLGIASKGWYGIPEGVVFSFPVRFQPKGTWSVVEDFDLSEEALQRLVELAEESQKDFDTGFAKKK
ncbi:hypothetical protein BOX15_Mlig030146g1, partial [Macrostomum lignano]